jgi:hypothetical protein
MRIPKLSIVGLSSSFLEHSVSEVEYGGMGTHTRHHNPPGWAWVNAKQARQALELCHVLGWKGSVATALDDRCLALAAARLTGTTPAAVPAVSLSPVGSLALADNLPQAAELDVAPYRPALPRKARISQEVCIAPGGGQAEIVRLAPSPIRSLDLEFTVSP